MSQSPPINIKVTPAVCRLIDRAAKISHRNRADFILGAAIHRAEEVILDQQLITVDAKSFDRFIAALDEPPANNPRLKKLMTRKAPWT